MLHFLQLPLDEAAPGITRGHNHEESNIQYNINIRVRNQHIVLLLETVPQSRQSLDMHEYEADSIQRIVTNDVFGVIIQRKIAGKSLPAALCPSQPQTVKSGMITSLAIMLVKLWKI